MPSSFMPRMFVGLLACLALAVGLAVPSIARADAFIMDGLEYPNVRIDDIAEGHLIYTTAAGLRAQQPLERIEAIKLEAHPQLAVALQLRAEGRHALALVQLRQIRTPVPWTRFWVDSRIMHAAAAAKEPEAAVIAYLELAQLNAPAFYLEQFPLDALAHADGLTRQRMLNRVQALIDTQPSRSPLRPHLERLRDGITAQPAPPAAPPAPSRITLPAHMRPTDAVTRLLQEGRFQEALEAVDESLKTPVGTDMKLYQRGLAQLHLAQQLEAQNQPAEALRRYKDAGLSFMRTVIYFPQSPYHGPALMEAGYVHVKIGRPDIAAELYEEARPRIDPENNPTLARRLEQLRGELRP